MRWLSRLVTVIVIIAIVVGASALLRSKMPKTQVGQDFLTYALFRDGSRLATSSPVMIAGVRVGEVSKLSVFGDFARIDMRLRDDTNIPVDSWVTKRSESAFGDSYLEIIPGGGEQGAPMLRQLQSGEPLTHVLEGNSTDAVLRSIARTIPKIDRGIDTLHDFAISGRKWSNGPMQDAIVGADRWLAAGHIEQPLAAADRAMERFEDGATRAAESVVGARPDVDRTLDRIQRGITSAREQMKDLKTGIHDGLDNARQGMDRIDSTAQQMADVTAAINEGRGNDFEGRLGRLINDPELGNTLDDVTDSAKGALSSFNRFKSWLGFRIEYNVFANLPRYYITAEIRGRNDRFYLVELEKGPQGGLPADQLTDTPGSPLYDRTQEIHDQLRFTAQFGKTLGGRFQLRGGIKDSTFGMGADLLLNSGKLTFSADLFGSFDRTPDLKLTAALEVFRSVYLLAGIDDMLNRPGYLPIETGNTNVPTEFNKVRYGRDYFLGATLHFTDADLALLVRVYGALIIGLL